MFFIKECFEPTRPNFDYANIGCIQQTTVDQELILISFKQLLVPTEQ